MSKQDPPSESTPKTMMQQKLEMLPTILELEAQGDSPLVVGWRLVMSHREVDWRHWADRYDKQR